MSAHEFGLRVRILIVHAQTSATTAQDKGLRK